MFFFALTRAECGPGDSEQTTAIAPLARAHLDADGLGSQLMLPMGYSIFIGHVLSFLNFGNLG
jgi:hypothetical protein